MHHIVNYLSVLIVALFVESIVVIDYWFREDRFREDRLRLAVALAKSFECIQGDNC